MLRKVSALCLALLLGLLGIGCTQEETAMAGRVLSSYFNGYLGITVKVPDGWQVVSRNPLNMTERAEDSANRDVLDKTSFGNGNYYIDLIELGSGPDPTSDDYMRIHLYAEDYKLMLPMLEDYLNASIMAYAGVLEDETYYASFLNSEQVYWGGRQVQKLVFLATSTENGRSYCQEYYICEIQELYFIVYGQYWADMEGAGEQLYQVLSTMATEGFGEGDWESSTVKTDSTRWFYNDLLGLQVKAPAGFVDIRNDDNLADTRGTITEWPQMQRQEYEDGGYYYDLVRLQNSDSRYHNTYAFLDIYVEEYDMFHSFDQYLDAAEKAYGISGGSSSSLVSRKPVKVQETEYTELTYYSKYSGYNGSGYHEKYLIRELGDGIYFVACLGYLEDSDKSKEDAGILLEETIRFRQSS